MERDSPMDMIQHELDVETPIHLLDGMERNGYAERFERDGEERWRLTTAGLRAFAEEVVKIMSEARCDQVEREEIEVEIDRKSVV